MSNEVEMLRQRAEAADKIIEDMRNKIAAIKENYVKNASEGLEERLIQENAHLRTEVASLKQQLTFMEVRNGVKLVPLPGPGAGVPDASSGDHQPAVVTATAATTAGTDQPAAKKEKKQKKEGAAEKKPKAPAADDKPVDVSRLDLRVGHIESVERHPDADGLYVEKVNLGDIQKTIISGLVNHVSIDELANKKALFICNLKPAKMRGILSEGMILCASCPEKVEVVHIPQDAVPGTRITFSQYPGEPDDLLAPKKKIWEQVAPDLKVDSNGVATYKGDPFRLNGEVVCKAPTLTNVQIK